MAFVNNAAPGVMLPSNTMNQRDSAHFIEVSSKYFDLITMEFQDKYDKIAAERKNVPVEQRLMKYAHPTYKYDPPKSADA